MPHATDRTVSKWIEFDQSASASDRMFPATDRDRERGFKELFSENERMMIDALHAQHAETLDAGPSPDGDSEELLQVDSGARMWHSLHLRVLLREPYF